MLPLGPEEAILHPLSRSVHTEANPLPKGPEARVAASRQGGETQGRLL